MLNRIIQKAGNLLRDDLEPAYRRMVEDLMWDLEALRDDVGLGAEPDAAPTEEAPVLPGLEPSEPGEIAAEIPASVAPAAEAYVAPIPPIGAGGGTEDTEPMVNGQPAQPAPLPGSSIEAGTTIEGEHDIHDDSLSA